MRRLSPTPLRPTLPRLLLMIVVAGTLAVLPACAGPDTADAARAAAGASAGACAPVPGRGLVVLADDGGLQRAENVVPAVTMVTAAANPALVPALDAVSAALDTDQLVALNAEVELSDADPAAVAAAWIADAHLADGGIAGSGGVVVGAASSPESEILAHLYAGALDAAGFDARVEPVGDRAQYLPALVSGTDVQVVPEYLASIADDLAARADGGGGLPVASADVRGTYDVLTSLADEAGLIFGEPSPAVDRPTFAVTEAFADAVGVRTLSELASACGDGSLVLGAPADCPTRPVCRPGLEATYGLSFAGFSPVASGGGLSTRAALEQGEISLGLIVSSDAALGDRREVFGE